MIDKNMEPYYDAILSIFLGIICILSSHNLYNSPRIIVIPQIENYSNLKKHQCCNINMRS